jgi:hypothetical protein
MNYTLLTFPALATGSGTAIWQYVTVNELLPSVQDLWLQFMQNGSTTQYRIDDILITGVNNSITIDSSGPLTFCQGGSVTLTSSTASQYAWSSGETTQSIIASSSGNYYVTVTSPNGCSTTSQPVSVNVTTCGATVNLKVYIDGLYSGSGLLAEDPALGQTGICDTLRLQLASATGNHSILFEDTALLHTDGTVQFEFPGSVIGNNYYLIVRHRNTLETWSPSPLTINTSITTYDFTDGQGKAYGSNLKDLNDGNFAIYSGDINADGIIDFMDVSIMQQSLGLFESDYLPADLNGNGMIESSDYSVLENNLFKIRSRP